MPLKDDAGIRNGNKIFIAMSGGVDSSVAAALLKHQGHDVCGVTMCFHISYPDSKRPSCCGVDGIQDARRAARHLGIEHYVLDFADEIRDLVIRDFQDEYFQGRTPNPCVRCNQYLKFDALWKQVEASGGGTLATGHYARIVRDPQTQGFDLLKAKDPRKDQSYFLYSVQPGMLSRILFPLGGYPKDEVRRLAADFGLETAHKPESQDICFVPDSGYQRFLENLVGKEAFVPGPFKDHEGRVVGEHQGIARYTIGQRDRLGLALGVPVYVFRIERETNTVYVGPPECLFSKGLVAHQVNLLSPQRCFEGLELTVRIRYNAPEVRARITRLAQDQVALEFAEPQKSVTPGQSVVFYQDDIVLGGGIIEKPV